VNKRQAETSIGLEQAQIAGGLATGRAYALMLPRTFLRCGMQAG
jgi:hypothetical protein